MKTFRFLTVLVLIMAVFGMSVKPAAAQLFPAYITGTQVMNVGSGTATITITYYDGTGGVVGTTNDTIGSFLSKTYFPPASGSAVISSDQPLAAVTNVQDSFTETAAAAYIGASAGSTSVGLPLLMKANDNYYTWFTVQNAGSADATVNVSYSDCTTNPNAVVIKPGAGYTYYQQNETCHSGKVFSAQLSSGQPIVAVVVQEKITPFHLFNAYSGFPKGSKSPVLPLINSNNNGTITGVQIQNLSTSASSTVTLSYTPSVAGTACTETQTIPAASSKTFAFNAFFFGPYSGTANGTTTCIGNSRFVGSALVTANSGNVDLTVVVNQLDFVKNYGEAYGGFDPADATGTVVLPLIRDRHTANQYFTGISVMNIGPGATSIKCTFSNSSYVAKLASVAQYSALVDLQAGKIAVGYVGSAVCKGYTNDGLFTTVDPNAKLVAIVNQLGSTPPDHFLVYEGIDVP